LFKVSYAARLSLFGQLLVAVTPLPVARFGFGSAARDLYPGSPDFVEKIFGCVK
jgi:hypothetical protein